MSKIAVVLCVVLFAAAADAAFDGVFNDTMDVAVGRVVNNVILKVELDMRLAHERAEAELERILTLVFKKADDFSKKVMDVMVKSHADMAVIFERYEQNRTNSNNTNTALQECSEIAKPLYEVGGPQSRAMTRANKCLVDELKKAYSVTRAMGEGYARGLANIATIRAELEKCSEIEDRFSTQEIFMAAEYCPETVAAKVYEVSAAVIPVLTTRVTWLSEWWKIGQPKFDACTTLTKLDDLRRETAAIIKETAECIEAKIKL